MPTMNAFLIHAFLPIAVQTVVVCLSLWWAAGEGRAWMRALLLAAGWAALQMLMLLCGGTIGEPARPMGFEMPFFVLCILPLPMVFLLARFGMGAAFSRAHDAVGVAIVAPLVPLLMRSSELELSPVLLLPLLVAFFLSFWLPTRAGNHSGGYVSMGGELLLSLALVADCVVLFGLYLMLVAPLVQMDSRIGALSALAMVFLLEFAAALTALHCPLRRALPVAVAAGLLLPLWVMVIALTLPF
ncbi:MAG: hypothetical protein IJ498_00535 [Akkermansia sp.]|nr:hypothetical protein [Akkermansia sp.]